MSSDFKWVAYQYYSVKHFELRIWFGEKVKGEGLKVFSSPFPLPLFPKTRQVLERIGIKKGEKVKPIRNDARGLATATLTQLRFVTGI